MIQCSTAIANNQEPQFQQRLLSEALAAKYISRSRDYLRHGRCDGNLPGRTPTPPFRKIGRSILYEIGDLDAWIEQFPKVQHLAELTTDRSHALNAQQEGAHNDHH